MWAKSFGGPTGDAIGGLALHGTDVFVTGGFQVSMLFDPGPTLAGQPVVRDVFVAKLMDEASGIEDAMQQRLVLYPDPVVDRIRVRGSVGVHTYNVLDQQGKVVLTGATIGEQGVDVSALAKGSFVLCLDPHDGEQVQRLKFVKE